MKLFTFKYDLQGVPLTIRIVACNIEKAIPAAHLRCGQHVGDNFQKVALDGGYLENISVAKIHDVINS